MTSRKKKSQSHTTGGNTTRITVHGNQNAVATNGGTAIVTHVEDSNIDNIGNWREKMEGEINSLKVLSAEDKALLIQSVKQVASEANKGKKADKNRLERLLNSIFAMSPEIFDVAITTLVSPLAGIGLVAKKVGEKAKIMQKT